MSGRREYPTSPIVGVGAILFHEDGVLLVRRGHEPLKGEWSLPGGRLELGETLTEGVLREVKEETGLTVKILEHIKTLDRIFLEENDRVRHHYVLVDYLCVVESGELRSGDDAADARWHPVADVLDGRLAVADFTTEVIAKAWAIRQVSP